MPRLTLSLLCAALFAANAAIAAPGAELRAGADYEAVSAAPQQQSSIEVIEFFSYGCPHCNEFHPMVGSWSQRLPQGVTFKRVPIDFNRPSWTSLAKLYYALEATGDLRKLDSEVFAAIHTKNERLNSDEAILEWAATRVADSKRFADAYRSFDVQAKVQRARQLAQRYAVQGVPAMAVDRYRVLTKHVTSYDELLAITDRLITKAAIERNAALR